MPQTIDKIIDNRDSILECEFSALLHLISKTHAGYLEAIVRGDNPDGKVIEHLPDLGKQFQLISREKCDLYKVVGRNENCLNICHRRAGAEEKGGLTRTQASYLQSPFGQQRMTPFRDILSSREYGDLMRSLSGEFERLMNIEAVEDRRSKVYGKSSNIRKLLEMIPGESREPGNDLSVWDQSVSVAALYKSMATYHFINPDDICTREKAEWRILVIRVGRSAFLGRSSRIHDLLAKQRVIEEIMASIRRLLEIEVPIGNRLYMGERNGWMESVFTFPALGKNDAESVIDDLASRIRRSSDHLNVQLGFELPVEIGCTAPRRLASECFSGMGKYEFSRRLFSDWSGSSSAKFDICPVCRIRRLDNRADDACKVCRARREGRLGPWLENRHGDTIWISEIADVNNKISLLTISLDLKMWLTGQWFSTVCTQRKLKNHNMLDACKKIIESNNTEEIRELLIAALPTVAPGAFSKNPKNLEKHKQNLLSWYDDCEGMDDEAKALRLASRVGTVNPSLGRLMRVVREADYFSRELLDRLHETQESKRVIVKASADSMRTMRLRPGGLYSAFFPGEEHGLLTVVIGSNRLALIESLDQKTIERIRDQRTLTIVPEDEQRRTGKEYTIEVEGFAEEPMRRMIPILSSPDLYQLLLPSADIPEVLILLGDLYEELFRFVRGKLPLNVSLAVSKRKHPLYSLMEGGEKLLAREFSSTGGVMKPWWPIDEEAPRYYRFYPTSEPEDSGAGIFDYRCLAELEEEEDYWLTTGYSDFAYLSSAAKSASLQYLNHGNRPARPGSQLGWMELLPLQTYEFIELVRYFDGHFQKQSNRTALHNLESVLHSSLSSLRCIPDGEDTERSRAYKEFFSVTLQRYSDFEVEAIPGDSMDRKIVNTLNALHFYLHVIG